MTRLHYFNAGATYWIDDYTAIGLRGAIWLRAEEGLPHEGERSLIATLRAVL